MSLLAALRRPLPGTIPVAPVRSGLSPRQYGWALLTVAAAILPHGLWLPLEAVAVPLAFLGVCWWQTQRSGGVALLPGWFKLALVALLCSMIVGRYGTLFGRPAGASLLVTMLALKAAECRSSRDVRVMVSIAFFVIVAAFLFEDSALLVLYMFAATGLGFAAMEVLEQRPGEHSLLFARLGLRQVLTLLLISVPLTLVLWLFFPRLSTPLWGTPEQAGRSGLSDKMRPGDIVQLLSDDKPQLRVTFEGALPPRDQLYFRGATLWLYDGSEWRGLEQAAFSRRPLEQRVDLRYNVYQEASDRRWLFALDRPAQIDVDARLTFDRQLLAEEPITGALSYNVGSQLRGPYQPQPLNPYLRRASLALPPGFDPQTRALGARLQSEHGGDSRRIAEAIMRMFTEQPFFYSLEPPPLSGNRIDEFLFVTRTGYCEHYASAFANLARAAGVPARVVLGYLGGVYNQSGGYLTVRNADAHAWVEVWIDDDWLRLDPTAAIAPDRVSLEGGGQLVEDDSFWGDVGKRVDALSRYWREFVVQFNALKQSRLLRPFGIDNASWEQLGMALGIGGALVSLLAGWYLWRRRPPFSRDPWIRGWRQLRQKLARAGVQTDAAAGPSTMAAAGRARLDPAAAARVAALLAEFEAAKYANQDADPAAGRAFGKRVRALRLAKPGRGAG